MSKTDLPATASPEGPTASREPLTRRMWIVIFTAALCNFQAGLNLTIMSVAFPALQRSWPDASRASLSWVLSVYTIVTAAVLIPAGVVADRVGHRRVALIGLATFVTGSITSALSPSVPVLITGRVRASNRRCAARARRDRFAARRRSLDSPDIRVCRSGAP